MTHFLRRNGKTIVDVEATKDDIHCVVCIDEYSWLLLENLASEERMADLITDFNALQELRGEYHENTFGFETTDECAKRRLQEIADRYNLAYVTD